MTVALVVVLITSSALSILLTSIVLCANAFGVGQNKVHPEPVVNVVVSV